MLFAEVGVDSGLDTASLTSMSVHSEDPPTLEPEVQFEMPVLSPRPPSDIGERREVPFEMPVLSPRPPSDIGERHNIDIVGFC